MLDKLMRAYVAFMMTGETGLMLHLVGPPGSGKSSVVDELAVLTGTRVHKVSVPRISPLEVEGLQMPVQGDEGHRLKLLIATHWNRLEEGDILFFDEFLAGFKEVYAALLDIFTSREVGGQKLPRVFMIAASNSAAAPTPAMSDRLQNLYVRDPRKLKSEKQRLAQLLVKATGMLPAVVDSIEMNDLLESTVLPTFDVMDHITAKKSHSSTTDPREGKSLRNLISQVRLRLLETGDLKELVDTNNSMAMAEGKPQYVIITGRIPKGYEAKALALRGNPQLTAVQATNLELNIQLIELGKTRFEEGE